MTYRVIFTPAAETDLRTVYRRMAEALPARTTSAGGAPSLRVLCARVGNQTDRTMGFAFDRQTSRNAPIRIQPGGWPIFAPNHNFGCLIRDGAKVSQPPLWVLTVASWWFLTRSRTRHGTSEGVFDFKMVT